MDADSVKSTTKVDYVALRNFDDESSSDEEPPTISVHDSADEKRSSRWEEQHHPQPRYPRTRKALLISSVLLSGVALGLWARPSPATSSEVAQARARALCNPYAQYGRLNVSPERAENKWIPVNPPPGCEVVDFMSQVRAVQKGEAEAGPSIDFVRGKTITLIGDSIDRNHIFDLCDQLGSSGNLVYADNPLSPPYPLDQPVPSMEGYPHGDEWHSTVHTRPVWCYIDKIDFLVTSLFHFGFQEQDQMITWNVNFYPPAMVEERVDQITIPLLENLARKLNRPSAAPDLVSLSSTFWSIMREIGKDQVNSFQASEIRHEMTVEEAKKKWWGWRSLEDEQAHRHQHRTEEILRHVGALWTEVKHRPRIMWRVLHSIHSYENMPMTTVVAVDQIARSVVKELADESRDALDPATVEEWHSLHPVKSKWLGWWGQPSAEDKFEQAREDRFDRRLFLDTSGDVLKGTEFKHFRDDIHPDALPGAWLWGNMMFEQLRQETVQRQFDSEDELTAKWWWN